MSVIPVTIRLPRQAGITLIELLIAVAIIGIIAAVAYPSYLAQVQKTRRADATTSIIDTAQQLERCFTVHGAYNSANCSVSGYTVEGGHYVVAISDWTATTYTITATAQGAQLDDANCRMLVVNQAGQQSSKNASNQVSTGCW